eukprot:4138121-Amphidinium_carterae.1
MGSRMVADLCRTRVPSSHRRSHVAHSHCDASLAGCASTPRLVFTGLLGPILRLKLKCCFGGLGGSGFRNPSELSSPNPHSF